MTTEKYLAQYDRDYDRLLNWLSQNGADKFTAALLISTYANTEKIFKNGHELDRAVLNECLEDSKKRVSELLAKYKQLNARPSLWDRIKSTVKSWMA